MQTFNDLQRLLAMQESKYGRSHIKVSTTLETIADLHSLENRFSDAEQLYWRVFEIRHGIEGQSLHVATVLEELAHLNEKQGNRDEAEHLLRRACEMKKKLCGAQSEEYQRARACLQQLLGEDFTAEDDEFLVPTYEGAQRAQDFPWTERFNRGVDLLDNHEYEGAEELFSCLVAFAEHFSPRTVQHARSLDHLARAYLFQGRFRESVAQFEQALSIFENTAGADDMDTVECLEGAADAHAALDQYEQSRFLYHWALTVAEGQGFQDPAERIHSKLALLPFKTPDQVQDEEQTAAARALVKPQRLKKKTSATHVSLKEQPAPPTGIPAGGMKALLQDVGPPPKRKTGTVQKISVANLEASTPTASPISGNVASPTVSSASISTTGNPTAALSETKLPDQTGSQGKIGEAKGDDPTTTMAASRERSPGTASGDSPQSKATETVDSESTPAASPTTLDEILKDLVPRRKKTTNTIMKPSLASLSQMAQANEQKRDTAQTAEHSVTDEARWAAMALAKANADFSQVSNPTAKIGVSSEPASIPVKEPVKENAVDTSLNMVVAQPEGPKLEPPTTEKESASSLVEERTDSGQGDNRERLQLPAALEIQAPKPVPTFDELLAAGGIIQPPQIDHAELEQLRAPKSETPARLPATASAVPQTDASTQNEELLLWEEHRNAAKDYFAQRNYAEAERCSLVALEFAEKLFPPNDRRLWHAHCQLAAIFEARAKFVPAARLYTAVLKMCERTLGANHQDNAKILEQLGALYMVQDRWDQAEDCYVRAIKILERVDENDAADAMSKLSVVRRRKERMQRKR